MGALLHPNHTPVFVWLGYWSSVVFTLMIFLTPSHPHWFYRGYDWIGLGFLALQMLEIVGRDNLSKREVLSDHAFAIVTLIVAFGLTIYMWQSSTGMSRASWQILNFWHACAWFDLMSGIGIGYVILNARYQRGEHPG